MLIAHYHWQVGLVADGRLLAAAEAASSDTARGFAGFTRVFPPIPLLTTYACRESLGERVGVSQSPRPPTSVWDRVWATGQERRGTKTSLPLPPISLSLTACPPSASPSEHEGPRSLGWCFPGCPAQSAGVQAPSPRRPRPSQGSQQRRRWGEPLLASFSKVPADTKAVS